MSLPTAGYNTPRKRNAHDDIGVLIEAGPHGFAPWRCFSKAGYSTHLIGSGSLPNTRRAQKTDRDDAIENLNYHCSGLLRYVHVPDEEDEYIRECLRERQHVMWAITGEKQKLRSLLKRPGTQYTQTKTNWTKTHGAPDWGDLPADVTCHPPAMDFI